MPELTDHDLLADFVRTESEEAFAALVTRHVNLVYSTALRSTGNAHHAEEITQAVFIVLVRKAATLPASVVLSGWLYQTTRFTAANLMKAETRRQQREQEAYMQSTLNDPDPDAWQQIAPLLEDAMGRLGETDRNALVLRFFENKTAAEAASLLNLTEAATHKRTNRALDKLRKIFSKHGVSSTTSIIAGALSTHSIHPAPTAVVTSVKLAAAAKGTAASASTLTLIKGALKIMAWTKAKTAVVIGVAILIAAGTTTQVVVRERKMDAWRIKDFEFPEILAQVPYQVRILPTKFPDNYMKMRSETDPGANARHLGVGAPVPVMIMMAWDVKRGARMVLPTNLPSGNYDCIANLPHDSSTAFQKEIEKKFGVTGKLETLETNVLFLKVKDPDAPALKRHTGKSVWSAVQLDGISDTNEVMSAFANQLEDYIFRIPVIDQTGLAGSYDFHLSASTTDRTAVEKALADQLGLELVPGRAPVEMLVVEKTP